MGCGASILGAGQRCFAVARQPARESGRLAPPLSWNLPNRDCPELAIAVSFEHKMVSTNNIPEPGTRGMVPPGSVSPQSSASSAADDRLPNVEDIYDLLTSDLVQLEEKLAAKGSESLTLKEEKLHGLIKVELGERRGVEEIGLALIGGRFDLGSIGLAKEASPCVGSPLAPSASAPSASPTASASASPVVRQVPKAAQVWTLPDASPMSSRSSLRTGTKNVWAFQSLIIGKP